MKKLLFFFTLLFSFYGCEKDYNTFIEPQNSDYQVTFISPLNQFNYFPGDSTETITINFNSAEDIKEVSYNLFDPSGDKLNNTPLLFNKSGTNTYTAALTMSGSYQNGNYSIRYYVTDIYDVTKEIVFHTFRYDNGSSNIPPVISNALIIPDTLVVTGLTPLVVTVEAFDEDGPQDIKQVYFITYRPNGTTSGNQVNLHDDGVQDSNKGLWDERAGDGIYSTGISVNETNAKGTYRFDFQARDRSDSLSNIISYNVLIQ